ncbi:MAG: Mov34/MPN/PAD-1 family protein [Candidatus Nitrosopolaris sp.]
MNREVLIAQDSANNILEDSNKYGHLETGGLLFGKIIDRYIIILKVVNMPNAIRTQVHFEMSEDIAISETKKMEKSGLEYIGNWHKHLGYGGPSIGDDKQAEIFLVRNLHKQSYLSLILDSCSDGTNELIATDYYFDDSKFKKKEITTKKILSVYELDELLKNEQFNAVKFMELVERKLDDQHYGKATNSYIRKSPNIFLLQFQNFINKVLSYRVKLSSWDDEN